MNQRWSIRTSPYGHATCIPHITATAPGDDTAEGGVHFLREGEGRSRAVDEEMGVASFDDTKAEVLQKLAEPLELHEVASELMKMGYELVHWSRSHHLDGEELQNVTVSMHGDIPMGAVQAIADQCGAGDFHAWRT